MSSGPTMKYFCCDELRRGLVRAKGEYSVGNPLNGIDYVEVIDHTATDEAERQRRLKIYFIHLPTGSLKDKFENRFGPKNVRIDGGDRMTGITCLDVVLKLTPRQDAIEYVEVLLSHAGDFSTYTLRLVESGDTPLSVFDPGGHELLDPLLTAVDFNFKVECPGLLDCKPACDCADVPGPRPELDYLAKDYASFRQLLLDRFAVLTPQWRERNPADLGVTLVELLAYVGDYLSYRQDAIATEAYLGTARRRSSVRRHAKLLDYPMHDGSNARTWVQVCVSASAPPAGVILPRLLAPAAGGTWQRQQEAPTPGPNAKVIHTRFLTHMENEATIDFVRGCPALKLEDDARFDEVALAHAPEVFEPLAEAQLYHAHNEIAFYTWGSTRCCLPSGATRATLLDADPARHPLKLGRGDVLIFAEVRGPKTGEPADADRNHRHAVRLIGVESARDGLTGATLLEIEWDEEDALPFALCISSEKEVTREPITGVSVALGNLVPADHGWTRSAEDLPVVLGPNAALAPAGAEACGRCGGTSTGVAVARYRPALREGPLTQAAAFTHENATASAARFFKQSGSILPEIRLGDNRGALWHPHHDLLASDPFAPDFVAEVENDGGAALRFGDDINGMRPADGTKFFAAYRVGNGVRGNVGADALAYVATHTLFDAATGAPQDLALISRVWNPLAACGGTEPEPLEEVRQFAPEAFLTNTRRAVTPEDYAEAAGRHPAVQRAKATLRWTGSWHTIFLTVDRRGGRAIDAKFEQSLRDFLEPLRLAGHDLEIAGPKFLSVELVIEICVEPESYRGAVEEALLDVFSTRTRPDGTRGVFHPDDLTFGTPVYLSAITAAAQAVPGVSHVHVKILRRLGTTQSEVPSDGVLRPGPLEVIRLENDPSFPDRGRLCFELHGGK